MSRTARPSLPNTAPPPAARSDAVAIAAMARAGRSGSDRTLRDLLARIDAHAS
ncbi:hypothetical protein [Dactylosporangium sp. NPDC050588]|uniref:hypothetical protein n=1 Tax=Dactylosporangium sp. NPDC050588 TaxID=3157211 RepID=UPI003410E4DC